MDTDSGSVIYSHQSFENGAYAIWKQKYTGECYVVIRGTHSLADFMVDAQVAEFYDNEVGIYVHLGVRKRTDFILNDIGDRLKVCNNDIIITGHSLGAAVAHYLFLRYVYYHYYSWDLKDKAKKFKAVMFGAPQLLSRPNDQVLKNQEYCINWYKYGRDAVTELISRVKSSRVLKAFMFLFKPLVHKKNLPFVNILPNAYDRVKKARYGNYIPGNAYHLSSDGSKVPLNSYYRITAGLSIADHINLDKVVDILTKGVWAETPKFLNFKKNSNEEETLKEEKNSVNLISEDEVTINSARSFCINVNDEYYDLEYEDNETTLYVRKDNST